MFKKKEKEVQQETKPVEQPKQETKEDKPRFELVEITATTQPAIYDNETKETMDLLQAIVEIRNDIDEIKKYLAE